MTATSSADKIFTVANGEVGYHEGSNNQNKYASAVGVANNQAWCTTFASWCFLTANLKSLCLMSDYSVDQYNWFNAKGRASAYPAVGAVVWFGPGGQNHTGLVYAYDAKYIYTIEGNYNNEVNYHKRLRLGGDDPSIGDPFMYGVPAWDTEGAVSADPQARVSGSRFVAVASVTTSAKIPGIVSKPVVTTPPPPVKVPPVTTPPVTTRKSVTTKVGDTYASVAAANGVALADLLAWNGVIPVAPAQLWTEAVPVVVTPPPVDTTDYTVFPANPSVVFGLGATNGYVAWLTAWLKAAGGTVAPTSTFTTIVQSEMSAYQAAQGFSGSDADGIPGATTWALLKSGTGNRLDASSTPTVWVNSVAINNKTGISYARYNAGGTVASWISGACAARGITDAAAVANWTKGYQTAIARESSGDANACNTNDSNDTTPAGFSKVADFGNGYGNPSGNLNGTLVNYQCSRGCAQCIPQTFASWHCPGTSNMIYDPIANIASSMGYVVSQYGVKADGSNLASKVQQFDSTRSPAGY